MKKKLCHVFFDEYPKDSRIRRYTNALLKEGYEVFIVSLNDGNYKFFEKENNTIIFRLPLEKKRGSFLRRIWEYLLFQVFASLIVSYIFLRHRVMIYHTHTLPDFLVFTTFLPKAFGAKVILDFHELFPEFMMQHKPSLNYSSFIIKLISLQERLSFNFANEIIVFHDPARKILTERVSNNKNITTIMNGVDESELPVFKKRSSNEFKLIYNGTINFNLNLSIVIKALALVRNKNKEVYNGIGFYLYGDGPDLKNILEVSETYNVKNLYYKGRLKFREMMKELETASACVLPPKKDVYSDLYYSIKLTEMIYYKIPVIATRLNTYLYYYPEGSLIYFNSNDVEDLAQKIIFTYNNQNDLKIYTDNAFNQYQKNNWGIMKARYLALINSLNNNS